jgi:tetratricopeptide (TPR) repeat protein
MADYQFTIPLSTFDVSLLPPGSPSRDAEGFSTAVHKFLQEQFAHFKGDARIVVSSDVIHVEWRLPSPSHDPIEEAVARLEKGEFVPAIAMLELLRQRHPTDIRLLYNLGLAYSDLGRLEQARAVLTEAVRLHPSHVNACVALGVTYAKEEHYQEAVTILEKAVAADPNNSWAQRNLGGCLLALKEVERGTACLLRATQLNPKDQQAFLGLAEACRMADKLEEADAAYRQAIAIDEYSSHAQRAKDRLSEMSHEIFRSRGVVIRPDAVMYCLGAMEQFAKLSRQEVQRITLEIAVLGTKGFEVNNPAQQYQLRSMPGNFSGLHMLCIMYVGFKIISPDDAPSFDVAAEYAEAKRIFEQRQKKSQT